MIRRYPNQVGHGSVRKGRESSLVKESKTKTLEIRSYSTSEPRKICCIAAASPSEVVDTLEAHNCSAEITPTSSKASSEVELELELGQHQPKSDEMDRQTGNSHQLSLSLGPYNEPQQRISKEKSTAADTTTANPQGVCDSWDWSVLDY
ncbi:hypothetical protein ACLOJK_031902 [Asimina triloba]